MPLYTYLLFGLLAYYLCQAVQPLGSTAVSTWKRQLLDGASDLFGKGHKSRKQTEAHADELYRQIGQLKVENDFLSRKLGS